MVVNGQVVIETPVFRATRSKEGSGTAEFQTTLRTQETVTIPTPARHELLSLSVERLPDGFEAVITATVGGKVLVEQYPLASGESFPLNTRDAVTVSFESMIHYQSFTYPTCSTQYDCQPSSVS